MSLRYALSLAKIINCEIGLVCCRRQREVPAVKSLHSKERL